MPAAETQRKRSGVVQAEGERSHTEPGPTCKGKNVTSWRRRLTVNSIIGAVAALRTGQAQ